MSWHGVTRLNLFFSAVRGSSPCAPVRCCAAERPVDLAWAAPNSCARGGIRARREPATPPGPPSPLGRCAPAFVWLRTSAWRLHRGARGRSVAGAPSAPSYGAAAVLHFLSVKPALAPAGARSGPESRPFGLRSRLSNWGALVSLVPLDFKSDRQTGSTARSPTTSTWQFVVCSNYCEAGGDVSRAEGVARRSANEPPAQLFS